MQLQTELWSASKGNPDVAGHARVQPRGCHRATGKPCARVEPAEASAGTEPRQDSERHPLALAGEGERCGRGGKRTKALATGDVVHRPSCQPTPLLPLPPGGRPRLEPVPISFRLGVAAHRSTQARYATSARRVPARHAADHPALGVQLDHFRAQWRGLISRCAEVDADRWR